MKKQGQTYTTQEMLKLISNAGMNLLVRKKKTALESKIQRQKDECDYLQDILTGLQIRLSDIDPEFRDAQNRLNELQQTHSDLKGQLETLQKEIERLLEIQKMAEALQTKTAELSRLLGDLYSLQTNYDMTKSERDNLTQQYQQLNQQKTFALSALQSIKGELNDAERQQQTLISEIAGFDIEGFIKDIQTKTEQLEASFSDGSYKVSLTKEIDFVSTVLLLMKSTDDIDGVIAGARDEDIILLRGLKKIKEDNLPKSLKDRLGKIINEIYFQFSKEVEALVNTRQSQLKEISSLNDYVTQLQQTLDIKIQELKKETDFRDNSKAKIEELGAELSKKKKELEEAKSELQRLNINIELSKAFAEALEPINETLMKSNRKLYDLLAEYKESYERALLKLKSKI